MTYRKRRLSVWQSLRHSLLAATLIFALAHPAAALAEDSAPPPAETTPVVSSEPAPTTEPVPVETPPASDPNPPAPQQGPTSPTGAESKSYTYNESTGLWENSKYTWDPATNQTSPKVAPDYSYNPATGMWDTTKWIYDAPSGQYVPNVISTAVPPAGATTQTPADIPNSEDSTPSPTSSRSTGTGDNNSPSPATHSLLGGLLPAPKPGSTTGVYDLFYNAIISNNITSTALSGDALVNMNTLAGNALSGDAKSIATVLNLLQSVWNLGVTGNLFNVFTQNLFGNLVGDLWLNPGTATGTSTPSNSSDLTINASGDAAIHNTITLDATSGDAGVTSNTEAGNATSGSATVIANIINAINSSIVSGNSFLGMLNIYGNLDGDILLPQELISTLLAANALGSLDTSQINNSSILGEFTNTASTTNNVTASANSGNATVQNNTTSGNATSGDAETNVTVLNLTGRQVVGKNALLVFVNVLGTWVGMIVDAPTGTTSAAFGGGITGDNTLAVSASTNQAITNDIIANATSGDALVANNTTAGDATSGDAYAAINIANLNSSQFALSDWFGVLFINVFGTWNGSFGVDTAAGSLPMAASAVVDHGAPLVPSTVNASNVKAFKFSQSTDGTYSLEKSDQGIPALAQAQVLGSDSNNTTLASARPQSSQKNTLGPQRDWSLTLVMTGLGVSLLGAERIATYRSRRTNVG